MNWVSSISFLKLMLMFSNCPARRSNRCFAIIYLYRRVFQRNRCEQRNRNGSETTYLAYWLQPVQKEKDRVHRWIRGFFLFPPRWPSLVSLQTTRKLPSKTYTSLGSFQDSEWKSVAPKFRGHPSDQEWIRQRWVWTPQPHKGCTLSPKEFT